MDLGLLNLAEAVSNDVDGKGSVDDAHAHVAFSASASLLALISYYAESRPTRISIEAYK